MRIRIHLRQGFTLIELLLVIGIMAILATVVIIAINPSYQIAQTYNVQRQQDIVTILNAFDQFQIDHKGSFQDPDVPIGADCAIPLSPAPPRKVCAAEITDITCDFDNPGDGNGCVFVPNLAKYIVRFPSDPQDTVGGDDDKRYDYEVILRSAGQRLEVIAPNTQIPPGTDILTVTR